MKPLDILDAEAGNVRLDMSALDGKAVLITGATGLLGLNIIAALMKSPVRWIMGASRNGFPAWASEWLDDPRIVDLRSTPTGGANPPCRPDFVIHAAGYAQPAKFMADPLATIVTNVGYTDRLLQHALAPGGRFLFISSSEVCSGAHAPHKETDIGTTTPYHPRASYIESKRCGEAIVNIFREQRGISAMSARVCLAYGPGVRLDDQRAMSEIIREALVDKKIKLRDRGDAVRAYLYVTDAVEMLLTILLRGKQGLYNVGNPRSTTIKVLAEFIGVTEEVAVIVPPGETTAFGPPSEASLDIGRYVEEFGPRQFITLDEGLRRTIQWTKEISK
jgi:UDP-glucuronate decarboxylase